MAMTVSIHERERQELKAAAFTSWRVESAINGIMGQNESKTYLDYLEGMGLLGEDEKRQNDEAKKLRKEEHRRKIDEAADDIDAIMKADLAGDHVPG